MDFNRATGTLVGLAVGDALGTTLEFRSLDAPPFPSMASGPHRDIIGGGPFDVAPGQVTDDTQMACCLAQSLLSASGFDVRDVAGRYREWMKVAFDIGALTRASLLASRNFDDPRRAGRHTWEASDRTSAGNGSLMRTAPIAVYYAESSALRRIASFDDSAVTHFDPRCRLACASFNAAIAHALTSPDTDPESLQMGMMVAAEKELGEAAEMLKARDRAHSFTAYSDVKSRIDAGRDDLFADLVAARLDDPDLYSETLHLHDHQGFVRVAFRLAFWELLHAPGFVGAVVDVVNRGGDADTNGAITGALVGACYGATDVPGEWTVRVLDALQGYDSPFADPYHPRRLLDFLDQVQSTVVDPSG